MSILPDFMIRNLRVGDGRHVVEPFIERTPINGMSAGLSCAGYDIRTKQGVTLAHGQFALLSSIEHFWMPNDVIGRVADKSTWARRGIAVQNTVIEPGWRGWLTLEVSNHGRLPISIQAGDPIAQIVFEQMMAPPERPYDGKYQDQADRPVGPTYEGGQ
ncbi:dCTP deaminase [Methylobacterium sp.]|jgi:dCTP deaminase|uniref:dCTP deaminase n=1 Tax=Methylobacterium sp. TaxID=409 RepID=UPI000C5E85F0|nr:dCTP deaminase [Methylobacterium sp.]MBP30468.1 dCTP deaminase [Methylobacterium sp.]